MGFQGQVSIGFMNVKEELVKAHSCKTYIAQPRAKDREEAGTCLYVHVCTTRTHYLWNR